MRLLIVEDDRNLRGFLRKAFREEGYSVDEAASGDEGLEAAFAATYDCVVLDVMLPGRDGLQVLDELRGRGLATPILLLTARNEPSHRVHGLERGADDYLGKPFDLAELMARVQALVRRSRMRFEDPTLRVGHIVLDPLNRRVTAGDRVVDLTPREFALLEFLMRNAGRTLSRARIAEAVWNYQFDSNTNVVDVYITYLRRKLGDVPDGTELVTVRGVGYRLDGPRIVP
jgi:DNA-binding response OmpR family regulator